MNQPLKGVKVVDCTFFVAGPSAGMNLAEWGADVIKVEPLNGEPNHNWDTDGKITSRDEYFNLYNRKKRDVAVNTKSADGREMLYKLLESADVFLTSYRPGALKKMGLDWETLHERFPHLVYGQITGFGDEGPGKDAPGFDTVAYWARSGLMQDLVNRGSDVLIPPIAFGDLTCGVALAGAIGTALFNRTRTGLGERVSLSLYAMALYSLTFLLFDTQVGGEYPKSRLEPAVPMAGSFKSSDGKWFFMTIIDHEKFYAPLMKLIGREDLLDDERYMTKAAALENREDFVGILDEGFAQFDFETCLQKLTEADIAYSTINHVKDNLTDPQALANDFLQKLTLRDGMDAMVPSGPVRFGGVRMEEMENGPLLGADTVEVFGELGYTEEQLKTLEARGAIRARW